MLAVNLVAEGFKMLTPGFVIHFSAGGGGVPGDFIMAIRLDIFLYFMVVRRQLLCL